MKLGSVRLGIAKYKKNKGRHLLNERTPDSELTVSKSCAAYYLESLTEKLNSTTVILTMSNMSDT